MVCASGTSKTGTSRNTHTWGTLLFTADINNNKAEENIIDPGGRIVASKRFDGAYTDQYYFYRYDIRGSVTNITDSEGAVVKGYEYDAYGNTIEKGDAQFKNSTKFTGAVQDKGTGLYYMNARHYNPSTGRFLQQDTYSGNPSQPWTQNLYTYCGNNPVNMIDPTGHQMVYVGSGLWIWLPDAPGTGDFRYAEQSMNTSSHHSAGHSSGGGYRHAGHSGHHHGHSSSGSSGSSYERPKRINTSDPDEYIPLMEDYRRVSEDTNGKETDIDKLIASGDVASVRYREKEHSEDGVAGWVASGCLALAGGFATESPAAGVVIFAISGAASSGSCPPNNYVTCNMIVTTKNGFAYEYSYETVGVHRPGKKGLRASEGIVSCGWDNKVNGVQIKPYNGGIPAGRVYDSDDVEFYFRPKDMKYEP